MKPNFIGIGGGRSGTSWIYNCLYEHPELCLPFKEVTYFSNEENYAKGQDWYESHFIRCEGTKKIGEISVYLTSEVAPERIFGYAPSAKLFVSLRNPIDRAFSNYQNELKGGFISPSTSFEEAMDKRPMYLERSHYHAALQRWLQYFNRDQLLVLIYEDGLEEPADFIQSIYEFLEVDPGFQASMLLERVNEGGVLRSVQIDLALDRLSDQMRWLGMQRLIWVLKRSGVVGFVRRSNLKGQAPAMTSATRKRLDEVFAPDIEAMENFLGRELNAWKP